tara:strand:- start:285 stop:707 length:423 start_codon:yes stop_codon:yes gene_type:complete
MAEIPNPHKQMCIGDDMFYAPIHCYDSGKYWVLLPRVSKAGMWLDAYVTDEYFTYKEVGEKHDCYCEFLTPGMIAALIRNHFIGLVEKYLYSYWGREVRDYDGDVLPESVRTVDEFVRAFPDIMRSCLPGLEKEYDTWQG